MYMYAVHVRTKFSCSCHFNHTSHNMAKSMWICIHFLPSNHKSVFFLTRIMYQNFSMSTNAGEKLPLLSPKQNICDYVLDICNTQGQ